MADGRRASRSLLAGLAAAAALAVAPACQQSLVDQHAPADQVNPSCQGDQAICGGVCVAEDAAHCGSSCAVCSGAALPDAHAVPACVAHACGMACAPGWLRSGQTCQRASAISAGFAHTCALLEDGAVRCWGANEHGQLGDGTTQDRAAPVEVRLPGPASAVAAGYVHSCAAVSGDVYCWGDDSVGELGAASRTDPTRPAIVPGISGVTALSAGGGENAGTPRTYYGHTCALAGGSVWCWGADESGQLGDGQFPTSRPAPAPVGGLGSGATAVAAGDRHTCAVVAGAVLCWGADAAGELGDGGSSNAATPRLAIASGAVAVAAGSAHSCAAAGVDGGVPALWCWGDNTSGQVAAGVDSPAVQRSPLQPSLGFTFAPTGVAAGSAHTCAFAAGAAGPVCFGSDASSELGLPPAPRGLNVLELSVKSLAAGYHHTCALLTDGSVQCWGDDTRGQLGDGTAGGVSATPATVSGG